MICTDEIYLKIQKLREELGKEYETCYQEGKVNEKVIRMSQSLDILILKYIKEKMNL
jgi:hypothetical protein